MIIHHTGIVCSNDKAAELASFLTLIHGNLHIEEQYIPEFSCKCIMLEGIELIIPDGGPLLNWLTEHGDTIHHIAVKVDDVAKISEAMQDGGVRMVCEEPVKGIGGMLVNFIHPEELGIMIELVEVADEA